ncbi:hypothetical protein BLNAU_79 [Blattamonas nauphoetae]|uniref:Calmodulin n=1 Tax=Blattamonas nauphoetae TaxID=2049346 RepID=A0ABQ9YLZ6_9EUKA|nr:hypothetical protein BLNAU_79 [Blattamonas nauphoetae]
MTAADGANPTANFIRDEVVAAFSVFDEKKTGKLPPQPEQLLALLRSLGFDDITPSEVELLLFEMNAREKGGYDVDTLTPLVEKRKADRAANGYTDEQLISSALFAFNPEGGDFISADDFRMALLCTGEKLPEEEINSMIASGDPAGIGQIDVNVLITKLFRAPKKKKKPKKKK